MRLQEITMNSEVNMFDVLQLARATKKVHGWDVERTIDCMKETFKDRMEDKDVDMLECCLIEDELQSMPKGELFDIAVQTKIAIDSNAEWSVNKALGMVKSANLYGVCKSIILHN